MALPSIASHPTARPFFGLVGKTFEVQGFALRLLEALPDREVGLHGHDEAHVALALSGPYVSDAAPGEVGPMLVYNPPGIVHRDRFLGLNGRISGRFIGLTVSRDAQRTIDSFLFMPSRAIRLASPEAARSLRRAWARAGAADEASMLDAEALCLDFAAQLAPSSGADRSPRWLGIARAMLAEERGTGLTIGALARAVGVHPVHLARVFERESGESPGAMLRRLRVERAAAATRATRRPLAEIAQSHGFSDQAHMTRCFRAVLGITPGALRRG